MQLHQLLQLVIEERRSANISKLSPEVLLLGRAFECGEVGLGIRQALREIRKSACGTLNLRQ